jgi:hypothetical protein
VIRRIVTVRQLSGCNVRGTRRKEIQVLRYSLARPVAGGPKSEVTATTDQITSSTDSELDKCNDKVMVRFKVTV